MIGFIHYELITDDLKTQQTFKNKSSNGKYVLTLKDISLLSLLNQSYTNIQTINLLWQTSPISRTNHSSRRVISKPKRSHLILSQIGLTSRNENQNLKLALQANLPFKITNSILNLTVDPFTILPINSIDHTSDHTFQN